MTSSQDNPFNTTAQAIPGPDFVRFTELNGKMLNETAKFNAHVSHTMQSIGKEWTEFVGMRLREELDLVQAIHSCRSVQDLQQAYARFWQNAFTQYGDEAQRLLRLTQGAIDDGSRMAREQRDAVIHAADKAA